MNSIKKEDIAKYLKDNKNPKGSTDDYKTEHASKLGSLFPPYHTFYKDVIFVKGKKSIVWKS